MVIRFQVGRRKSGRGQPLSEAKLVARIGVPFEDAFLPKIMSKQQIRFGGTNALRSDAR